MDAPTLDYAPAPPLIKRRVFRRICWGIALVILLASGVTLLPVAAHRARLMYWQRRCLSYTTSADLVITPGNSSIPREWLTFYALLSPPGLKSDATVFLHERRRPDGQRRLIALDVLLAGNLVWPRVFSIGSMTRVPEEISGNGGTVWPHGPRDSLLRAGQPDPDDASHFTFSFRRTDIAGDRWGIIDGWLRDDDSVLLEERPEATPAPPPPSGPSR